MSCILGVVVATSLDSRRTSATTAPGARQCSGFGGGGGRRGNRELRYPVPNMP